MGTMTLYKRKPRNWWQRVWFWVKKPELYEFKHAMHWNGGWLIRYDRGHEIYIEVTLQELKANYEPVDKPTFPIWTSEMSQAILDSPSPFIKPTTPTYYHFCRKCFVVIDYPAIYCSRCDHNADASKMVYERDCPPNIPISQEEEHDLIRAHIRKNQNRGNETKGDA